VNNSTYVIKETKDFPYAYAVMIQPVPNFPCNENHVQSDVCQPLLCVIAAYEGADGWGFIALSNEEKQSIGDLLVSMKAELSRWYWCEESAA